MQPWSQLVLLACAVALTAAIVSAILALRGALRRTNAVLGIVEQELRPLIAQVHGVTEEVRELTHELRLEVKRVGDVTESVQAVAEGLGRLVSGLSGLARVGQIVGLAAGLRRGADVFVQRLRRKQGEDHGD
jgi:ABC-type transporter Mla subunit MlaD